jgi:hypothetical protein
MTYVSAPLLFHGLYIESTCNGSTILARVSVVKAKPFDYKEVHFSKIAQSQSTDLVVLILPLLDERDAVDNAPAAAAALAIIYVTIDFELAIT